MKILNFFLITYGYLALLVPYCYGVASEKVGLSLLSTNHEMIFSPSDHPTKSSSTHICQLIKQGDDYHDNSQYFQAIASYKEAIQQHDQHYSEKTLFLAQIYNNMGMSYLALKDYTQTSFCYHKALTLREQIFSMVKSLNNKKMKKIISEAIGKSHHNLAILYLDLQQPKKAIQSFEAALSTQWQYHTEAIDTQYMLANIYHQRAHYQASKVLYQAILVKQGASAYLAPETIVNIKKQLHQVTEKELKIRKGHFSNSPFNMTTFPHIEPNLSDNLSGIEHPRNLVRNQELGIRNYLSTFCKKKFTTKHNMKVHLRIHTGEKPFTCPVCDRKFTRKDTMKKHIKRIHISPTP